MDFEFSEEHEMLRRTVREFVDAEVRPLAARIDREHRIPPELLEQIRALGFLGIPFPEEYGGGGFGELGLCVFMEEITRGCFSTAVVCGGHTSIGATAIYVAGSEAQKRRWLPPLCEGSLWAAYALTEPQSGSDAGNMQMTAVRDGADWVLNGSKIWITNGDFADVIVTFCASDRAAGTKGITAFVVETDTPGFSVGKPEDKMGQCGSTTVEIHFQDVRVPDANRLGAPGDGFKVALQTLDRGRLTLGANCLGAAKEALQLSIRYAGERVAFGKPIAEQQAIQHMLADCGTEIYAMESMLYRTAWLCDQGQPFGRESAIVKLFCSEALDRIVDRAVQIHGGYGYSKEYAVERMYRDARVNRLYEGTSEIQRLVIARALLRAGPG